MRARRRLQGRRKLDGGCNTDASWSMVAVRAQEARAIGGGCFRRKGKGAKHGTLGRTSWFYRGDGREKGNRPPRSLGLPRAPPRHDTGHAPAVPILSHQKSRWTVRLPQANPDSLPIWETQVMKIFLSLAHLGPRSSATGPTGDGSTNDPKSRAQPLLRSRSTVKPQLGQP